MRFSNALILAVPLLWRLPESLALLLSSGSSACYGLKHRQQSASRLALSTSSSTESSSDVEASSAKQWQPKVKNLKARRQLLRGQKHNSETIGSMGFHHIEFYVGDARTSAQVFSSALGLKIVGSTGQHTGNDQCVSYALESGQVRFLLTAPYSQQVVASPSPSPSSSSSSDESQEFDAPNPLPGFSPSHAHNFFGKHGVAARAIGIQVENATQSFAAAIERGAEAVVEPTLVMACLAQQKQLKKERINNDNDRAAGATAASNCELAEVKLYGDVVLRFVSFPEKNNNHNPAEGDDAPNALPFLPHLAPTIGQHQRKQTFGLRRIDHAVGNVPNLAEALERIAGFTGFHEFAEFTPEDVGTLESGLNSVVLASDSENVLLPLNEPTLGKRKSQILTYLEQNEGAGLQHLALKTDDIFETIVQMRQAEDLLLGFELMRRPSDAYYQELPSRLGDQLTQEQYQRLEELGILADADDEGILLQIFTKPIGDRPTFFFEIIQRIGCRYTPEGETMAIAERPGCGGFGQGNFRELFKSIEDYEKTLKV